MSKMNYGTRDQVDLDGAVRRRKSFRCCAMQALMSVSVALGNSPRTCSERQGNICYQQVNRLSVFVLIYHHSEL